MRSRTIGGIAIHSTSALSIAGLICFGDYWLSILAVQFAAQGGLLFGAWLMTRDE